MKILQIFVLFLLTLSSTLAQEMPIYSNGLIYEETTISKLSKIAQQLNLKHKTCELNPIFNAMPQTTGYVISIPEKDTKNIKQDINNDISLALFKKKYPEAKFSKKTLIVLYKYDDFVSFSQIVFGYGANMKFSFKDFKKLKGKKWIFNGHKTIFYLPNDFEHKRMPIQYAKMVSYVDCMIDTNTTVIKKNAKSGWGVGLDKNWKNMSQAKLKKTLNKMRGMQVMGQCSMDNSPRVHAANIAKISAHIQNWQVFLRAHLNIMNDRFDRVSDGSYAWGQRKTYIKEIESIGIDTPKLLLGTMFRVENVHSNHYFGSISRLGRAFTESKDSVLIEKKLISMIEDKNLDLFNRVLAFFTLHSYSYHKYHDSRGQLAPKINLEEKNTLKEKVILVSKSLPSFFSDSIDFSDL